VGKELSKYTAGYPKRRNMIVAGTDVVSVDAVCARLMDINPDDVEHISLAALTGLGQNDLGQIEVRGSSIAESGTRFIKSESEILQNYKNDRYPYYGQGNRVWLLSGPHFGLDMDKDFLGGEADIEPIPGQKGWSEPVYFFDDPIDPAGYFQDTLDCVNYAFTYLEAQKQARGKLWLGSRQDLTVWLNGAVVYTYKGTRTHRLPNDAVEVDIRAGINRILVKSAQRYGVSEFSLNVCETESDSSYAGNRLAGIKFLSESEEADSIRADYNRDGRLNILDAVTLLRTIQENPSEECDFNGDGSIDVTDVIGLIVYIVDRK